MCVSCVWISDTISFVLVRPPTTATPPCVLLRHVLIRVFLLSVFGGIVKTPQQTATPFLFLFYFENIILDLSIFAASLGAFILTQLTSFRRLGVFNPISVLFWLKYKRYLFTFRRFLGAQVKNRSTLIIGTS